jgi:hypothetical protein
MTGHACQLFPRAADRTAVPRTMVTHPARGGVLIFDGRNPTVEAWRHWTPEASARRLDDAELGTIEAWNEVAQDEAGRIVTCPTF